MRYKYKKDYSNIKKIIFNIIFLSIIFSSLLFLSYISYKHIKNYNKKKLALNELKESYKKLFEGKNYTELIQKMDMELKKNPLSYQYLLYRGYSFFLLGEEEKNLQKRKRFFTSSLIDLRKSIAIETNPENNLNIFFIIGKIYFYLGEPYYNLSLKYLNKSIELGNKRKDLLYVLGLVYSFTGDYNKAINIYSEILKIEEKEDILLAIGICYYKNNDYNNALKYLNRVIKITDQPKIKERAYYLMGEILFLTKDYNNSLDNFNKTIEINANNANAYFYRGEIYNIFNDKIKARSEWRKTLLIDPSHIRALKRIY